MYKCGGVGHGGHCGKGLVGQGVEPWVDSMAFAAPFLCLVELKFILPHHSMLKASHILVIIFCLGLGRVSPLRFTSDGVGEWLARLDVSVARVVTGTTWIATHLFFSLRHNEEQQNSFVRLASKAEDVGFAHKFVAALRPLTFSERPIP